MSHVEHATPSTGDRTGFWYKAFLSYSHAADGQLAAFLQTALHRFARPWYRRRAIRVFRDTTGLELTPDLWGAIGNALESSEYFILLASERAAKSPWIDLELETWLRIAGPNRLLIVWTDGNLLWDSAAGDFDWARSTCLPDRLRAVFTAEPLHLDLRSARTSGDLSLQRPELADAIARISATLRHVPLDDLIGEDVRQHRRTRQLAGAAITTLAVSLAAAVGAAWFAFQQRDAARRALVDLLVANGVNQTAQSDLSAGALWFAEALRLEGDDAKARQLQRLRLRNTLQTHPSIEHVWFTNPEANHRSAVLNADDRHVISHPRTGEIASEDRIASAPSANAPQVWDALTGESVPLKTLSPSSVRILAVEAAAGHVRAVTTGPEDLARVIDGRSGAEIARLDGSGEVTAAEFGRDGALLLTLSRDHVVRLWDAGTGRLLRSMEHESAVWYAGLTVDGRTVYSATSDGVVQIWQLDAGYRDRRHVKLEHKEAVEQVDVSSDGEYMVTVMNRTARLWNLSAEEKPAELLRSWEGVNHAEFGPTGTTLLMADDFGEASVFGVDPVEPLASVRHNAIILHATFSPDGAQFATAGADRVARVWSTSSGTPLSPPLHHEQIVSHVTFASQKRQLVTTTTEGVIRLWNLDPRPRTLAHSSVQHVEFHPDSRRLLTANYENIKLWDLQGKALLTLAVPSQIHHAAFNPDGRYIVSASEDGVARVWDTATGREVHALRHGRRVNHVSVRPDGTWLVTVGSAVRPNADVNVWDLATGKLLFGLAHESERPNRAEFAPDGARLLTLGLGKASVWDLTTRQRLDRFRFDDQIDAASFSRDGRLLVVVADRSRVKVYDVERASTVGATIQHENYRIDHVAFAADSRRLLIAGGGYLRIWDAYRGVPLTPPLTHGPRTSVGVGIGSRDGAFLATAADPDGTVKVWLAGTGQPLTPPLRHGSGLRNVAFSAEAAWIVSAGGEVVRLWPLSSGDSADDAALGVYARVLAARQIDVTGGIVALDAVQFRRTWEAYRATKPPQ